MTKILVGTDVEVHIDREPDPYDRWDAGDSSGSVTNVWARVQKDQDYAYVSGDSMTVELDVSPGGMLYAVVADYESGSTFGRDGGHAQILDVFTSPEHAQALLAAAKSGDQEAYSFTHKGKDYSRHYVGYFDSLNAIVVWSMRLRDEDGNLTEDNGFRIGT